MEKFKLTLPESYKDLVSITLRRIDSIKGCAYSGRSAGIDDELGFLGINRNEEKLIAKIFLADEIEFVAEEYFWSLKGIDGSYVHVNSEFDLSMVPSKHTFPLRIRCAFSFRACMANFKSCSCRFWRV